MDLWELLTTHVWWRYGVRPQWYDQLYHGFNWLEGIAWCFFALLVLRRYLRPRKSWIEIAYAFAFLTFGITDFLEAYRLNSWLLAVKGVNLIALFCLRRHVMMRYYPEAKIV